MNNRKNGLGRGLSSLLGENNNILLSGNKNSNLITIPIEKIQPGPWQARSNFDKESSKGGPKSVPELGTKLVFNVSINKLRAFLS